jgi:short-subunit dehydrogenase
MTVVAVSRGASEPGAAVAAVVLGDVADEATATEAFRRATGLGTVSLLVNCAGAGVFGPAGSYGRADIDAAVAGNLVGTILFCERAIPLFRSQGSGTIVNVMSSAAVVARAGEAVYSAAKSGARAYTEAIRAELKGTGVRVVSVFPGGMRTSFWSHAVRSPGDGSAYMDPDEVAQGIMAAIAQGPSSYTSEIHIGRR